MLTEWHFPQKGSFSYLVMFSSCVRRFFCGADRIWNLFVARIWRIRLGRVGPFGRRAWTASRWSIRSPDSLPGILETHILTHVRPHLPHPSLIGRHDIPNFHPMYKPWVPLTSILNKVDMLSVPVHPWSQKPKGVHPGVGFVTHELDRKKDQPG